MLASPDRISYFAELTSLRDRVKYRLTEESARADEAGALEAGRVRAAATAAGERLERANRRRTVLERQQMVTTAQLDRLARRADRWQTFRDTVRGSFERRWLRNRMPPDWSDGTDGTDAGSNGNGPQGPAADHRAADRRAADRRAAAQYRDDEPESGRGHARWQAISERDPAAEEADGFDRDRALSNRAAWEGAAARPGMPRWIKIGVLGLLIAVEFPVYYTVFENLHGVGAFANLLSVSLTVAVAVAMILAPHIGGRILRRRSVTGAVRLSAVPALALIGVW
ncbi:hypothetical protein AB4Z54_40530, partial [Streptomyces sp. MCAF7]